MLLDDIGRWAAKPTASRRSAKARASRSQPVDAVGTAHEADRDQSVLGNRLPTKAPRSPASRRSARPTGSAAILLAEDNVDQPESWRCVCWSGSGYRRRRGRQRPRGRQGPRTARRLRRGVHGRADARDGRLRGHAPHPRRRGHDRRPRADHRHDRQRHGRRPRALPRSRHGRLHRQAGNTPRVERRSTPMDIGLRRLISNPH